MTTQNMSNQHGQEEIPVLTTIAPSIFVPTDRDFTKTPPPLSDDPTVRLETTIDALDWHAAQVERNMVFMLKREAERVRLAGQVERVQYDSYGRPVKPQQRRTDNDLHLEEMILREDEEAVLRILGDEKYRDSEGAGSNREGPRERRSYHRPYSPPPLPTRPRGPMDPEYTDLWTLRREKMFRLDVDECRQTPRSAALTHVLNAVKWGWDDQLEGHRAVVQKEKDERRANLQRQIKENPFLFAPGTGQTASAPPASAPLPPGRMRGNFADGDPMDIDR
ncbi:hypothetical protein F5Y09DRAFT_152058 [Xylaria sp. FL1042]|nr:hypothetical protein F5Y09DRAFT_152058 [Xylaria sp. FL1042]